MSLSYPVSAAGKQSAPIKDLYLNNQSRRLPDRTIGNPTHGPRRAPKAVPRINIFTSAIFQKFAPAISVENFSFFLPEYFKKNSGIRRGIRERRADPNMKGIITLKSENHSGEYKFDTEARSFVRVFKKIEVPTLYRVGETFDIDFYLNTEVKRIPEWKEKWIILSGSGRDISADYTKEAPLGLYHTNDIYDVLDQKDPDSADQDLDDQDPQDRQDLSDPIHPWYRWCCVRS